MIYTALILFIVAVLLLALGFSGVIHGAAGLAGVTLLLALVTYGLSVASTLRYRRHA
jgi:uncharacterized membrane protein YtjA (UPF0391 family)